MNLSISINQQLKFYHLLRLKIEENKETMFRIFFGQTTLEKYHPRSTRAKRKGENQRDETSKFLSYCLLTSPSRIEWSCSLCVDDEVRRHDPFIGIRIVFPLPPDHAAMPSSSNLKFIHSNPLETVFLASSWNASNENLSSSSHYNGTNERSRP